VIRYQCPVISEQLASSKKLNTEHCSLITSSAPNIIIETVKRAEDGNGFIVRFYESQRRRGPVTVTTAFPLARVEKVNLLEETLEILTPNGNQVALQVRPYEIVNLRVVTLPQSIV
jgi:alpha-mannosidase